MILTSGLERDVPYLCHLLIMVKEAVTYILNIYHMFSSVQSYDFVGYMEVFENEISIALLDPRLYMTCFRVLVWE